MAVINIMKDGTIVENMSTVIVPKEKMQQIAAIAKRKKVKRSEKTYG